MKADVQAICTNDASLISDGEDVLDIVEPYFLFFCDAPTQLPSIAKKAAEEPRPPLVNS